MRTFRCLAVLVALFGLSGAVSAESTPESVAEAYVASIRTNGLTTATDFIHPDELQRFKEMLAPLFADPRSPAAQGIVQAVFGPQSTVESVAAMDPPTFMRAFMNFMDGQLKAVNTTIGDVQVLGAVREGDTVHLVTRSTAGAAGIQITQLEVMSLKPYQDTWKLLLSGQMEGLAQALKAKAAAAP